MKRLFILSLIIALSLKVFIFFSKEGEQTELKIHRYYANVESTLHVSEGPQQIGKWSMQPKIKICQGAPVSLSGLKSAIGWWLNRGYSYSALLTAGSNGPCIHDPPEGYIFIRPDTSRKVEQDAFATTHVFVSDDNEIIWAVIYIKKDGVRERVLEHELGHAYGWLHYDRLGHIMHKKWTHGGWDDTNLRQFKSFPGARSPRRGTSRD